MCAYTAQAGLNCSAVQGFQKLGGLMFGAFTGKNTQVLRYNGKRSLLCDIGGACRKAQGLSPLAQSRSATPMRLIDGLDRPQILGVGDHAHTACFAYFESQSAVGFSCEQQAAELSPGVETLLLSFDGRAGVMFLPTTLNAAMTQEQTMGLGQSLSARSALSALSKQAYVNAGLVPMTTNLVENEVTI